MRKLSTLVTVAAIGYCWLASGGAAHAQQTCMGGTVSADPAVGGVGTFKTTGHIDVNTGYTVSATIQGHGQY